MASVNKILLIGNLGKDPEIRTTPNGQTIAKFPLATKENWTDQENTKQERTEWHNIVVWGKQAQMCGQFLSKGRQVYIEGAIRSRSYDDKEGNKRYVTEIVAQRVQFLGGNPQGSSGSVGSFGDSSSAPIADDSDDVPF